MTVRACASNLTERQVRSANFTIASEKETARKLRAENEQMRAKLGLGPFARAGRSDAPTFYIQDGQSPPAHTLTAPAAASKPVRAWLLLDQQNKVRGPFAEDDMLRSLHEGKLEESVRVTPADVTTGQPLGSGEYAALGGLVKAGGPLHRPLARVAVDSVR